MESIYRTIFFCQRVNDNYNIFYGHSIYWKLTSLDYVIDGWKRKNIQGDIYAFFVDLPSFDAIDQLISSKRLEINANAKKHILIFQWEQSDANFLINDASDNEYKPFISLCSKAIYYYSTIESEFIEDFLREKKESISRLEEEYITPLAKNPHLLNTFAIYTPTRIETSLQNVRDQKNHITGVEFHINDIFGEYQDCQVNFLLSSEGENDKGSFKLSDEPKIISTRFDPDYMEISIQHGEEVVFEEKCYFVKSININMKIISGSIKTNSGTVPTHSSSSFTIGGDSE
ncbi:hypothetical protein [Rheinheimera sp. F8]|uniref:hypothetical protein n=1 Tax=Rheinheimera sp. F8 TaxID=1763998 RepID=UPI000744C785|nr:hypothetical protein [Rheinheimera sp. F8]ALZ75394.1 hypothetical protein ATY27_06260 [Rheinheimera sp. F8]ALZ75792.1 hypothetical protein ATY27_08445 [Rheinheimera sp. F8]